MNNPCDSCKDIFCQLMFPFVPLMPCGKRLAYMAQMNGIDGDDCLEKEK